MDGDLIFYTFSRSKVERGDFRHFLDRFALDKLPIGRRLRGLMNNIVLCVDGYDDDPREIHSIPDVRRFYAAFHAAWPYWLYFCNLEQDGLKTMVAACLSTFSAVKVDGRPNVGVQCDPLELVHFIGRDFAPMYLIWERAGMFEDRIEQRTRAVFEYFGLPYDGEAPADKPSLQSLQ
jgi:hypothetical protein